MQPNTWLTPFATRLKRPPTDSLSLPERRHHSPLNIAFAGIRVTATCSVPVCPQVPSLPSDYLQCSGLPHGAACTRRSQRTPALESTTPNHTSSQLPQQNNHLCCLSLMQLRVSPSTADNTWCPCTNFSKSNTAAASWLWYCSNTIHYVYNGHLRK